MGRFFIVLLLAGMLGLGACRPGTPTDPDTGDNNPVDTLPGDDTLSWVLLAEGSFSAYEWDLTGDTVCDSVLLAWPRTAYDDPGDRFTLNEPVYPGDILRIFGRYESGNDVGTFAFGGDWENPGYHEIAMAALPDTLQNPGDTASFTMPYGGSDTLGFYIVVAMIDNGRLVCPPNGTDSVRFYYRLEKKR